MCTKRCTSFTEGKTLSRKSDDESEMEVTVKSKVLEVSDVKVG